MTLRQLAKRTAQNDAQPYVARMLRVIGLCSVWVALLCTGWSPTVAAPFGAYGPPTVQARDIGATSGLRQRQLEFLHRLRQADPRYQTIEKAVLNEQNELGVILNRQVEMAAVRPLLRTILTQMAREFPGHLGEYRPQQRAHGSHFHLPVENDTQLVLFIEHRLFNGLIARVRLPQPVQKLQLTLPQPTGGANVPCLHGRRTIRPERGRNGRTPASAKQGDPHTAEPNNTQHACHVRLCIVLSRSLCQLPQCHWSYPLSGDLLLSCFL